MLFLTALVDQFLFTYRWRRCKTRNTTASDMCSQHTTCTWLADLQRADLLQHPPLENDECCIAPFFCQGARMRVRKTQTEKNKADESNAFSDDESKHNTTPPDAKANAQSPAILSVESLKKSSLLGLYCSWYQELCRRRTGWYYQGPPRQDIYEGLTHFQTLFLLLAGK